MCVYTYMLVPVIQAKIVIPVKMTRSPGRVFECPKCDGMRSNENIFVWFGGCTILTGDMKIMQDEKKACFIYAYDDRKEQKKTKEHTTVCHCVCNKHEE